MTSALDRVDVKALMEAARKPPLRVAGRPMMSPDLAREIEVLKQQIAVSAVSSVLSVDAVYRNPSHERKYLRARKNYERFARGPHRVREKWWRACVRARPDAVVTYSPARAAEIVFLADGINA